MRRYFLVAAITAAVATLTGSALAGAAVPGPQSRPGAQLWVARFQVGGQGSSAMAASPGGRRVFVTGASYGSPATGVDYKTVAYSAATGRQLWASRYSGPGNGEDDPDTVAVSPGGARVFVTGNISVGPNGADYATVAYSAATGKQLWAMRYHGPSGETNLASAVAVSPGGATVFVTGSSEPNFATVAYSAATGRQLWVSRYNSPATASSFAGYVAVGPGGSTVFVTGSSFYRAGGTEYTTLAYSAATGRQLWVGHYNAYRGGENDPSALAVSPGGATVFVTGESDGRRTDTDYATIAYSAATGRQLWLRRYNGPGNGLDIATSLAVSPRAAVVFVTGVSTDRSGAGDFGTIAYNAVTGRQLWINRHDAGEAEAVTVNPRGNTVYVTGRGFGYETVAYRAATGRQLWVSRYGGPQDNGFPCCVAVSHAGTTVFVSGEHEGRTSYQYVTVAYRA